MQTQQTQDVQKLDINHVFNDVKGGIDRARTQFQKGNYTDCTRTLRAITLEMWGLEALVGVTSRHSINQPRKKQPQSEISEDGGRNRSRKFSLSDINQALRKVA